MDPPERTSSTCTRNDDRRGGGRGPGMRHATTKLHSSSSSSLHSNSSSRRSRRRQQQRRPRNEYLDNNNVAATTAAKITYDEPSPLRPSTSSGRRPPRRRSASANDLAIYAAAAAEIERHVNQDHDDDDYDSVDKMATATTMSSSPHYRHNQNFTAAASKKRSSSSNNTTGGSLQSLPSYDSLQRRTRSGKNMQQQQQQQQQQEKHLVRRSKYQIDYSSRDDDNDDDYGYNDEYDDAESLFSAASSSYNSNIHHHHQRHHSNHNRRISQSPSVTSRASQSSHNSSFRAAKNRYPNVTKTDNKQPYQYDSDDSILSLLSLGRDDHFDGEDDDDDDGDSYRHCHSDDTTASSSSSVSSSSSSSSSHINTKRDIDSNLSGKVASNCGATRKLVTPSMKKKGERMVVKFAETLSRLERLGLRVNSMDSTDGDDHTVVDGCRSNDDAIDAKNPKLVSSASNDKNFPWWIQELEAEGWFQQDTSTIYANGSNDNNMVTQTELQSGAISTEADTDQRDKDDIFGDGDDRACGGDVTIKKAQAKSAQEDGATSASDDMEDGDVGDWEERLWSLARAHYLEYYGIPSDLYDSLPELKSSHQVEVDEVTLKDEEQKYLRRYEIEQRGVLTFRLILLQCIETYVHAFHGEVGGSVYISTSKGEDDDRGERCKSIAHPTSLPEVCPYIPLSIARDLFKEAIKIADGEINSLAEESMQRGDKTTIDLECKADIVVSVLMDDTLNIFRRYQVITPVKPPTKYGRDGIKKKRKRLVNNRSKNEINADAELEDFLYGEMLENIIEDEEEKSVETLETKEVEIRIRPKVVGLVLNKVSKISELDLTINPYCAMSMVCHVLLSNVQTDTEGEAGEFPDHDNEIEHPQPLPSTQRQIYHLMAKLYIMRYCPIFLLRALHYQKVGGVVNSQFDGNFPPPDNGFGGPAVVSLNDLVDLLYCESYIRRRIELQGPFDATITHLSNWQDVSSYQNDKKHKCLNDCGDDKTYERMVTLISSTLCTHLSIILDNTGYDIKDRSSIANGGSSDILGMGKRGSASCISLHNFSQIASNCIETGRALHHLGVCLGRRQRDCASSQDQLCRAISSGNGSITVPLEVTCYKKALDAYRAAITILSKAEIVTLSDAANDVENPRQGDGIISDSNDVPNISLHDIREAKGSVELHLADTLNCLGFCHDKLLEYDKSLLAYRESLSMYVKHVGRSHTMVSKVLHNMGAVHVEQGRWNEATSCFRQCLTILKQKEEKERNIERKCQLTRIANCKDGTSQILVTLQCLGNSLAELGEYEASIACFDEILNSSEKTDLLAMDVMSQMGWVHFNQASKLSREFNRSCHTLICSDSGLPSDDDPGLILDRQIRLERVGKDSFTKSIRARKQLCYTSSDNVAKHNDFSFMNENKSHKSDSKVLAASMVSEEAPPAHVAALAKDLLAMGRLELRSRSYPVALSYLWECVFLCSLLAAQRSGDVETSVRVSNSLVLGGMLLSQDTVFQASDEQVAVIDSLEISAIMDSVSVEFIQVLFLIGVSYTRTHHFMSARKFLLKALSLLKLPILTTETNLKANGSGTLESVVVQLDNAHLLLRIGYVESMLGNIEAAASQYEEAIQVFRAASSHPFCTIENNESSTDEQNIDDVQNSPSRLEFQRNEISNSIKLGLACAFYHLGVTYSERSLNEDAMDCFEGTARIFKDIQAATDKYSNWTSVNLFSFTSRCFWEEASAINTVLLLSDVNERIGRICMNNAPDLFCLECFERSIGIRELVTINAGCISVVDTESLIECCDESDWDRKNLRSYSDILRLLETREESQDSYNAPEDGDSLENGSYVPSKGDILFRLGNLQSRLGQYEDAIISYREAEKLTVEVLGTKEHGIVMTILHNMGNAFGLIANSSLSRRRHAKDQAIACYSESMRISQVLYGKTHLKSAELMQSLATLHMDVGKLWLAISIEEIIGTNDDEIAYKYFKEALSIRRKETGSRNELEVAFILHHLGNLCLRNASIGVDDSREDAEALKLLNDAMSYLSESLNIRKLLLDPFHTSVADTYQSIGVAHLYIALTLKHGDKLEYETRKAFRCLNSAIEIRKSNLSNKCSDSVLIHAHCLFHLGRVEEVNLRFDCAKLIYINVLQILQTEGEQNSSLVSKCINIAAGLDGRLLQELEAINLWVARVLCRLAVIHKINGSVDDCIRCYEEALRIRCQDKSAEFGLINARTHLTLAQALQDKGSYDKSIGCYSRSLRLYIGHYGKDSVYVADILTGLGMSFAKKLAFRKTMQCYNKAMCVYEFSESAALKKKKGLLHRDIAATLRLLEGDIFEVLENYRSCVSFLEDFSEWQAEQDSIHGLNELLLQCYSELLVVLRQVLGVERDLNIKDELYEEIDDVLHRMGNLHASLAHHEEALRCFIEVLPTQRKANEKLRVADILFNMGNIYLDQCHYENSLECLRESYDITREVLGDDNKELHSTMYLMSIAMAKLSDFESALIWLQRSLSVLSSRESESENVKDKGARGKTLSQMGMVCEQLGDHKMALSSFQESVQLLSGTNCDDRELSSALNSMGDLLMSYHNIDQALDCYCKSLTISTKLGDDLMIANAKTNIGTVLSAKKVFDRAISFSAQALFIKTNQLGCDSAETGGALVKLGHLYLDQLLHSRAEKYFGQGLKILQNSRCVNDIDISMCLHKLGIIKEALNDDSSALDYYLQCIHIFKKSRGFEKNVTMASSLHNAALIYMRQKDFHSALDCMTDAFNTKLSAYGLAHRETASSQHFLGIIYLEIDDTESAQFHLTSALNTRRECPGEQLEVARTLFGLGRTHFIRDEFEEVIKCLSEALISRKLGSIDEVSRAELQLGSSYQELGSFEVAMTHLFDALHLLNSTPESNQTDISQALFRLGICFCETGQFMKSLEKFNECLEMRKLLLGNLHIECANTYESIGIVQQKTGCHEEAINSFERALAIKKTSLDEDDEDVCVLLHFIGISLFELNKFKEAIGYFQASSERKKKYRGREDEEYALSVIGLAAAYSKMDNEHLAVEFYREAIESGGLSNFSWELGVAHKFLAQYFNERGMHLYSIERYQEAVKIFEWNIKNTQCSEPEHETLAQCYAHLVELEEEVAGPLSENRAELCYKLANCHLRTNKLEEAVLMYREAMMIQTQLHGVDHLSVANSLHNIGNCYRSLSDFEKSADCLAQSLLLLRKNLDDENEEVADTCHCLALTRMAKCELEEATSLFETAIAIWKKKLGNSTLKVVSTLNRLALIDQMKGAWSSSLVKCNEALQMQRMIAGDDESIMSGTLECMGRVYMDKREFEPAINCFRKCISQDKQELQLECGIIYRTRGESLRSREMFTNAERYAANHLSLNPSQSGEIDPQELSSKFQGLKFETSDRQLLSLAERVMFYGLVLMNIEKFDAALICFRFSNVIYQAKYGSDHLTIAANFYHTGYVLEKISDSRTCLHRLEEALELLTESFRIRRLHLVESHSDVEETLLCLGRVHHKLGNLSDALNFFTDAVKSRHLRFGRTRLFADDTDALLRVGQLQQQSGKLLQALDSFDQCLDIRRKIVGSEHPSVGEVLFYIGNLKREIGDLDSAVKNIEESLTIAQQVDQESIAVADILFSLGVLRTEQKQFSSALGSYLASLQIQKAKGSKTALAEILNNIGITYFEMKEFDKALIYHEEALESLRQELGDDHSDVAFCWFSLGTVHQEKGNQADALACFQQAVKIERSELYLQSLGCILVKMDENENAYVCLDEALRMKVLDSNSESDDDLAEIKRHLGIILMRRKRFDESLRLFEEALTIKLANCSESENENLIHCFDGALKATSALFGTHHMKYAHLLHRKGNFFSAKKDHALAIEAYVEALRIYKELHGDSHLSVANTLFNLGISLNSIGSPDKAIRCLLKALRVTKARLGEDHLDVADTYEQIAESQKLLHRYHEAKEYYENALSVRKQANGESDVKSAAIMNELGKLHASEGAWVDAEKAFEESINVRIMLFGQDDPLVAESMHSLGLLHMARNDSLKALKYLEGSLRIRKSKLANNPQQLADSFHALGAVHCSLGNVCKSVFCYDKSIQLFIEVYGKTNDRIASSLAGKGKCLCSDKQYRKALSCFSECLDIRKSVEGSALSKESGDVLSLMGDAYSHLGDDANTLTSFASALATYRQILGSKHQIVADVLQKMAEQYVKVGEFECGYSCVKEALAIRKELVGDNEMKTGDSLYCQGRILYEWKNDAEALQCFERAREIFQNINGLQNRVADSNFYLGCISERRGDFQLALQYLQASLSERRTHVDEFDSDIAMNLSTLGRVYMKISEFGLAVSAYSDCLQIREANRGADKKSQIEVADALFDLGSALQKSLDTQRSTLLFTDALKVYQLYSDNPNDAKIAQCHLCLGGVYASTKELTKAMNSLEQAMTIFESHVAKDPSEKEIIASSKVHAYSGKAETLFCLATVTEQLGDLDTALKQYRRAMRIYKALFGLDSLFVGTILYRIAMMKGRDGSIDKAMILLDESLRIRKLNLGHGHEDVAETLFGMGVVLEKRKDYGAAMKTYSDCLRIRSSKFGSDSMEVAEVVVNIGVVRSNKGDIAGAQKSWSKALSIYRKKGLGDDEEVVAAVLEHQRLANNQVQRRGMHND